MNDLVGKTVKFDADNPRGFLIGQVLSYDSESGTLIVRSWDVVYTIFEQNVQAYMRKGQFMTVTPSQQLGREI